MNRYLLFVIIFIFAWPVQSQNIVPDSTFGNDGISIIENPDYYYYTSEAIDLENGDLIINSYVRYYNEAWYYHRIIKIDSAGNRDLNFGENGEILLKFYNPDDYEPIIEKIGNDKFVVFDLFKKNKITLKIYSNDGELLNDFEFDPVPTSIGYFPKFINYYNNSIFIGAEYYEQYSTEFSERKDFGIILKIDTEGTIDSTFSNNGLLDFKVEHRNTDFNDQIQKKDYFLSTISYPKGSIFHPEPYTHVIKFNENGTFDDVFGGNGILLLDEVKQYNIFVDEFENIYLCDINDFSVTKRDYKGAIIPEYGESGIAYYNNELLNKIHENDIFGKEGEIYIVGSKYIYHDYHSYLFKYNTEGNLISLYRDDGNINFDSLNFDWHKGFFDKKGRLLVMGEFINYETFQSYFSIARLKENSPSSTNFISDSNSVTLFPNPVTGNYINIDFENNIYGKVEIDLFDINNRFLCNLFTGIKDIDKALKLNIPAEISNGIYLVKTTSPKVLITKKILILQNQ